MATGYGHEVDLQQLEPGSKAAAFYVTKRVASYVSKSCDSRSDVPWWSTFVDQETGEVLQGHCAPTFRTWSQSKNWGQSMAQLRQVARRRYEQQQDQVPESVCSVSGHLVLADSHPLP